MKSGALTTVNTVKSSSHGIKEALDQARIIQQKGDAFLGEREKQATVTQRKNLYSKLGMSCCG